MKTILEQYMAVLGGSADDEDRAAVDAELARPDSRLRRALANLGRRGQLSATARRILPGSSDPATAPQPARRPWPGAIVRWTVGAAAALLLGFSLGWLFRGQPGGAETLSASAALEVANFRGPDGEKLHQVRVSSPLDGFAVVLALAPESRQKIYPRATQDDLPVPRDQPSEAILIDKADATRVVFVVAETPAAEPIRRAFEERKNVRRYFASDEADLRRDLETFLRGKGYRRIAIGSMPVPREP